MSVFVLLLPCFLSQIAVTELCEWNTYPYCYSWGSCSRSCGGGIWSRICESCVLRQDKIFYGSCNENCLHGHPYQSGSCRCPSWRTGTCCEACRHIYIPHCVPGHQYCGGKPDGIKCTLCEDPYYSAGYNRGCSACPTIDHCISRHCTNPSNTICLKCENIIVTYELSADRKSCNLPDDPCLPNPCNNSATCSLTGNSYQCACATGYSGRNCTDIDEVEDADVSIEDYTSIIVATAELVVIVCVAVPIIYAFKTRRWCFKKPFKGSINSRKISVAPNVTTLQTLDY